MFFIAGITGKVGGAAARQLLEKGYKVRTLARDPHKAATWSQQGVEVRQGDLTDAAAVTSALEGVEGAFVMQPTPTAVLPSFPEAKAINASLSEALRQAPPPRLVVLSSVGSQQKSGLGNITQTHLLEEALSDLPFPIAFIRAGAFMENNLSGLERAASSGWFDSFLQPTDHTFPMIATADIGTEVAHLLMNGWSGKKIVELGSPYSPNNLAQAMSEVLGRPVQARPIPREGWTARLATIGLPPSKIGPWEEMQDGFNSGWIDFGVPGTEPVAATTTPLQVFARARKAQEQ
jgi:NAD(P)H dehydrogenase (quinone)